MNQGMRIRAIMARHGMLAGQRQPYYGDHDERIDPLDDKETVRSCLAAIEREAGGCGE